MTNDQRLVAALQEDWHTASLSAADQAMLAYVEKLTMRPSEMREADVAALREHGFSDAAVLDICQVTAYYAYANRVADGLGVEVEAGVTAKPEES